MTARNCTQGVVTAEYKQVLEKGPGFVDEGRVVPEGAYTRKEVDMF